jgi:hypothetical protein
MLRPNRRKLGLELSPFPPDTTSVENFKPAGTAFDRFALSEGRRQRFEYR